MSRSFRPADTFSGVMRTRFGVPPNWRARQHIKDAFYTERSAYVAAQWKKYTAYLETDTWHSLRAEVIERDKGSCQACHNPAEVVHHLTYHRVFREHLGDLVALCGPCHDLAHDRGKKDYGVNLTGLLTKVAS